MQSVVSARILVGATADGYIWKTLSQARSSVERKMMTIKLARTWMEESSHVYVVQPDAVVMYFHQSWAIERRTHVVGLYEAVAEPIAWTSQCRSMFVGQVA